MKPMLVPANEKGVDAMETAERLSEYNIEYINRIDQYIKELKEQSQPIAARNAREALYRTGVATEDGKVKDKIISWE